VRGKKEENMKLKNKNKRGRGGEREREIEQRIKQQTSYANKRGERSCYLLGYPCFGIGKP
jgi:hypothetical protein